MFSSALLYALRGAVPWESGFAFFRRTPDRQLDGDDLKAQAARLCTFVDFVTRQTGEAPFLVGYSNGAIIAARRRSKDAQDLYAQFITAGADVRLEMLDGGHGCAEDSADEKLSRQWLVQAGLG